LETDNKKAPHGALGANNFAPAINVANATHNYISGFVHTLYNQLGLNSRINIAADWASTSMKNIPLDPVFCAGRPEYTSR